MAKPKKKKQKYWYIQPNGTYPDETLVFAGYSVAEIKKIIARQKDWKKGIKEEWLEELDVDTAYRHDTAYMLHTSGNNTMIILPNFEYEALCYDTLSHECLHLALFFARYRGLLSTHDNKLLIEEEAIVYMHEYLTREIRRKLYNEFYD